MDSSSDTFAPLSALTGRVRQILQLVRLKPFDVSTASGRAAERHRRIAISSLAGIAAKIIGVITLFVTVPLTIKYLGTERYGLWMTMSSVIAMLAFADLGIGSGLINVLSEAHGNDDLPSAQRYVSSAWMILSVVSFILLVAFFIGYPFVPWDRVFNLKSALAASEIGPAIIIFAVCFVIGIPLGIVPSVQSGYQDSYVSSLWIGAGNVISFIGVLFCVWFQARLPWLVLSMCGGPLLSRVGETIVLFTYQRPALRPRMSLFERHAARRVFKTGMFFFALSLSISIGYSSDNMVITQVLGPDRVSEYAVTYRLFSIAPVLMSFVLGPLWPAYGEAAARGDVAWVRRTLFRSLAMALLVIVVPMIFLVAFGQPIIYVWSRHEIWPSRMLLLSMGAWTLLIAISGPLAMFLNGLNVVRFQIVCASIMAVVNIVLSVLLSEHLGVSGAILGSVISQTVCIIIPVFLYIPRLLNHLQERAQAATIAPEAAEAIAASTDSVYPPIN